MKLIISNEVISAMAKDVENSNGNKETLKAVLSMINRYNKALEADLENILSDIKRQAIESGVIA